MKKSVKKYRIKSVVSVLFLLAFSGCSEYFNDPLVDKQTGENINLILVDFNFFNTRMTFKLIDAKSGTTIYAPAKIKFSGKNGADIVTFTGEKKPEFFTSQGQLELTADPNVAISPVSPFDFVVTVEAEGYNTVSKGLSVPSEGLKSFEVMLSKIEDEEETQLNGNLDFGGGDTTFHFSLQPDFLKSAEIYDKPFEINYSTSITSLKKFKDINGKLLFTTSQEVINAYNRDPENFMKVSFSTYSPYPSSIDKVKIDGVVRTAIFQKLETGKLLQLTVAGKVVYEFNGGTLNSTCKYLSNDNPGVFGFVKFGGEYWEFTGTSTVYETLDIKYTLAKAAKNVLCEKGSSLTFKSNMQSSFSIDADVFGLDGKFITLINFKGKFPQTFTVENVPGTAVKLKFRSNNPSFGAIAPLEIQNFCEGNYEVNVPVAEQFVEYQIVLKALCPSNKQVAIAPSFNAEVRLKNSTNQWQGISMQSGIVDILGLPGKQYELRLLWDGQWEYSTFETNFDANGNYIGAPHKDSNISAKKLSDGRIQIIVEKIFEQNICNDLGW